MRRLVHLPFFLLAWASASPCAAQVLGTDGNGAYPLRIFAPILTSGFTYEFETVIVADDGEGCTEIGGELVCADTVLALRPSNAGLGTPALAGADGCGAEWQRSCFVVTIPGPFGEVGEWHLFLRAWITQTYGTAEVRMRRVLSEGDPLPWTSLGTVTFGGATVARSLAPGTGAIRFETAHAPGQVLFHSLWIVPPGRPDWDIRFAATANSTRTFGAAAIDIPNAGNAGLATGLPGFYTFGAAMSQQVGDVTLTMNEREPALDYDRDGLSAALEESLRTCDRPTDLTADGWDCSQVGTWGEGVCAEYPAFATPLAAERCRAALRDTDFDGLPDDLETYGFLKERLPQWGASPRHHDVFVEVDTFDTDDTLVPPLPGEDPVVSDCDGFTVEGAVGVPGAVDQIGEDDVDFGVTSVAPNFFESVASTYGRFPFQYNPDARPGISVHYDVGVASPNPRETRYGAWGAEGPASPRSIPTPIPAR